MTINKVKSSSYDTVKTEYIVNDYIKQHANSITDTVNNNMDKLKGKDRTQLKQIAAELETVQKRLLYMLNGQY